MSKIERIAKENILGIKSYKSKKEKILNIGLRALFFVFVLVSLTYLSFRNFKKEEVKANPGCTGGVYTYACCNSTTPGQDCWAYYGKDAYGNVPVLVNRASWTVAGTQFAYPADYTAVSSSNDSWRQDSETTNIRQLPHDFVMHITETPATITSLTLKWEGHAAIGNEAAADNDLRMYVLDVNASPNAWFLLNDTTCANNACPSDVTITSTITSNITHYIDGSGYLRFMVQKYEGKCAGTTASCYPDATGTCVACGSTCQTCSGGSCVAATTDWGAGTYGCAAGAPTDPNRCYNGSCINCGGWGNAGYCWYGSGSNADSCNGFCTGHGGVYNGSCDWVNDPTDCSTCNHWYAGYSCAGSNPIGPNFLAYPLLCTYHADGNNDCTSITYRQCACNM